MNRAGLGVTRTDLQYRHYRHATLHDDKKNYFLLSVHV